jgi:hypothetical protein
MKLTTEGKILLAVPLVAAATAGLLSQCAGNRYVTAEDSQLAETSESDTPVPETSSESPLPLPPPPPPPPPPSPCVPSAQDILDKINGQVTYPGDRVAQLQQLFAPEDERTYLSGNWYDAIGNRVSSNDVWVITKSGTLYSMTPQAQERGPFESWNTPEDLGKPAVATVIGCVNAAVQQEEAARLAPLPPPEFQPAPPPMDGAPPPPPEGAPPMGEQPVTEGVPGEPPPPEPLPPSNPLN